MTASIEQAATSAPDNLRPGLSHLDDFNRDLFIELGEHTGIGRQSTLRELPPLQGHQRTLVSLPELAVIGTDNLASTRIELLTRASAGQEQINPVTRLQADRYGFNAGLLLKPTGGNAGINDKISINSRDGITSIQHTNGTELRIQNATTATFLKLPGASDFSQLTVPQGNRELSLKVEGIGTVDLRNFSTGATGNDARHFTSIIFDGHGNQTSLSVTDHLGGRVSLGMRGLNSSGNNTTFDLIHYSDTPQNRAKDLATFLSINEANGSRLIEWSATESLKVLHRTRLGLESTWRPPIAILRLIGR